MTLKISRKNRSDTVPFDQIDVGTWFFSEKCGLSVKIDENGGYSLLKEDVWTFDMSELCSLVDVTIEFEVL